MARTDDSSAVNAEPGRIVEYGIDPRGWSMFAALSGAHRRDLVAKPAVIERNPEHNGYMRPLQRLVGLAPLGLGTARPVAGGSSEIGDERSSQLDNPALRIFAERLKRNGMQL